MTKPRGRQQSNKGLVDMATRPAVEEWAPDLRNSDRRDYVFPLLGEDDRVIERTNRDENGQVIDFALIHEARVLADDGGTEDWEPVIMVDCAHGEVHVHRYEAGGREVTRSIYVKIQGADDVRKGYDHATTLVIDKWEENRRRWEYGR